MILEVGYIISEFGYDIRLVKSCVTTSYGFLIQMAPHTHKQIDLTSLLLLQLSYCVSVLLLTSRCKSAPAQYTNSLLR